MVYDSYEEPILYTNPKLAVKKDIEFINGEIIAKNADGTYTKYSKALKAVSVIGMTKEHYVDFWTKQYNKPNTDKECLEQILTTIDEKFSNGLTDQVTMLHLIKTSRDCDKEKKTAINLLLGCNN